MSKQDKLESCYEILDNRPDLQDVLLRLASAPDIGKRVLEPDDLYHVVQPLLAGAQYERLVAVGLDDAWNVIATEIITMGSVRRTPFDVNQIIRWGMTRERPVSYLVVAHNHPSGDPQPSADDIERTNELAEACDIVSMPLADHLIVTDSGYWSMASEGDFPETVATTPYVHSM